MSVRLNKQGQWEIEGSERGVRFHRVLRKGQKRSQAVALERKIRADIFTAKVLGNVPDYSIGEGIMRYLREFHGKSKKQTESHARALAPYVTGKSMDQCVEVADAIRHGRGGLTRSTRNRRISILRRVASLAYRRWGWLSEPLHEKIELLPENPARQVYLSRGELAALVLRVDDRECRRGILMAAFTGMRRSELLGLEPHHIRNGVICLHDTKTGSPRNIPIIPSIAWAFRRPLKVEPTRLSKSVQKASEGKVRFHDLRHTCASLLANQNVPDYIIAAILGHKSRQTTRRYAHLNTSTLERAMVDALKGKKVA